MSEPTSRFDFRAMGQELKSNPKTQIALAVFALILIYALYTLFSSDTPTGKKAVASRGGSTLDPRRLDGLRKLPDLAALGKAGELPPASKIQRDLFMFEAPPPPVVKKVVKEAPPPPPPSAEELERRRQEQLEATEYAGRPQDLRYLGFFKGSPSGTVGAFMKGEEPVTIPQGTLVKERWKLVTVLDVKAEFQNTKYPKLRLVLEAREVSGAAATNNF